MSDESRRTPDSVDATEQCALCLRDRPLRESHYLPAFVYRDMHREQDSAAVHVTREGAYIASRAVKTKLLCEECEQRFSARGEEPIAAQCYRLDGSFLLRDVLAVATPARVVGPEKYFRVSSLPLDPSPFIYFAASVYWRGVAAKWRDGMREVPAPSFTAAQREAFRRFLLDDGPFPAPSSLWMTVASDEKLPLLVRFPSSFREQGVFQHTFCIPGIEFRLLLGGYIESTLVAASIVNRDTGVVTSLPLSESPWYHVAVRHAKVAPKKGRLGQLEKR